MGKMSNPGDSISNPEEAIHQLQNALIAAMEEVDQLRNTMYLEQGKLQREFRESIDILLVNSEKNVNINAGSPFQLTASAKMSDNAVLARIDYLEAQVKSMQTQRDLAPTTMDKVLKQTKTFLEQTDSEIETIRLNVDDKMKWVDQKMAEVTQFYNQKDLRNQEQFDELQLRQQNMFDTAMANQRRREQQALQQVQEMHQKSLEMNTQGILSGASSVQPELELKIASLTKMVNVVERRANMFEETISQIDNEQRDLSAAVQTLNTLIQAERVRNVAPRGITAVSDMNSEVLSTVAVRDEVLRILENDNTIKARQTKEQLMAMKEEIQRGIVQTERNTGEITRVATQFYALEQAMQRLDIHVTGIQEKTESEVKAQFARAETAQKSFFSRQDQILASERHQMSVKISSDLQKMQYKALEDYRIAEARRMEDIRASHTQLRDDFTLFVNDQRADLEKNINSMKDFVNGLTKEQADLLSKQFREMTDDTRRAMINGMDDVKKLSTNTSEELRRIKSSVEENTLRLTDQHTYLHNRVQQVMDEEVKRFDRIAEDARLRLGQHIETEVQRTVSATEGTLVRSYLNLKDEMDRDSRLVKEELEGIRGILSSIAAPSATMSAFESRMDALRKDITQLHVSLSRVQDLEVKLNNSLQLEVRKAIEDTKSQVMRDVSLQLQSFDRSLCDLAQEQQAQYILMVQNHQEQQQLMSFGQEKEVFDRQNMQQEQQEEVFRGQQKRYEQLLQSKTQTASGRNTPVAIPAFRSQEEQQSEKLNQEPQKQEYQRQGPQQTLQQEQQYNPFDSMSYKGPESTHPNNLSRSHTVPSPTPQHPSRNTSVSYNIPTDPVISVSQQPAVPSGVVPSRSSSGFRMPAAKTSNPSDGSLSQSKSFMRQTSGVVDSVFSGVSATPLAVSSGLDTPHATRQSTMGGTTGLNTSSVPLGSLRLREAPSRDAGRGDLLEGLLQ
eukprot:Tbor_TRINITY_DN2659_c0_g1::TRINITY_DN2659_c0_g1_i1::g.17880::m.17880